MGKMSLHLFQFISNCLKCVLLLKKSPFNHKQVAKVTHQYCFMPDWKEQKIVAKKTLWIKERQHV